MTDLKSFLMEMRTLAEDEVGDFRHEILAMLDRWIARHDERTWRTERDILSGRSLVLMAVQNARSAWTIERLVEDKDRRVAKANSLGLRAVREDTVARIAEGAAARIAAINFKKNRARVLGRKQGNAHIQYFKTQCSADLMAAYGQPFDKVVADLTEIVFDCGPISVESVRAARKSDRRIRGLK